MKKKYIVGIFIIILLIGGGIFVFQKKQSPVQSVSQEGAKTGTEPINEKPAEQQKQDTSTTSSVKNQTSTTEKKTEKPAEKIVAKPANQGKKEQKAPALSQKAVKDMSQDELLAVLQDAGKKEQYVKFADYLLETYSRKLQSNKDFQKAESAAYVKATDYLDKEKNLQKTLDTADVVYKKVPFGWRFKYLRVRALEALGRKAFKDGDLTKAENYARTMLQMEFRIEGTNILGDIAIHKIQTALAKGDKKSAREVYEEIKAFEISADRRATLDELVKKME